MTATEKRKNRQIRFEITTAAPLPAGEQVFISGDTAAFGNWDPSSFALTREKDNLWTRTLPLPVDKPVHYKLTRGSWASEEVDGNGTVPEDKILLPGEQDFTVQLWVHHWKDLRMGPPPQITGNYDILENVESKILGNRRTVLVWKPESYTTDTKKRYPVIYIQDGQQIFNPQTSTWGTAWDIDDWCTNLIQAKVIPEVIVVAPYCTEAREAEYNPDESGKDYIQFIREELMDRINADFRTLTGPENTTIAGASLGGLISFYAAWKHPDVFSKAACLSPALAFNGSTACTDAVKKSEKKPDARFFIYCGNGDSVEQRLLPDVRAMVELLKKKNMKEGTDFLFIEDETAHHDEIAWRQHADEWLKFLLNEPEQK